MNISKIFRTARRGAKGRRLCRRLRDRSVKVAMNKGFHHWLKFVTPGRRRRAMEAGLRS